MDVTVPDYELAATVLADTPEKMRAIVDPLRLQILDLVMDRAATVTELAMALDRPKSSVAYHVDVLVDVGMLQVVRTRRVRAIEEKFYGRTGRTIVYDERALPERAVAPNFLAAAIAEARPMANETRSTLRHARISHERLDEFFDRIEQLAEEFTMLPREGEVVYGFIAAAYPTDHPILPTVDALSTEDQRMSAPDTDPALDIGEPSMPKRRLGPSYFKLFSASTISNLGDGVGLIAYPWLASAVTRNPILIALVAVAQRLPWLVFTLPAGVITDRNDRRTLMIWSNAARTVLTVAVAFAVLNRQGTLPGPEVVADETIAIPTNTILYGIIILATLLMGIAEVLYDNSAQTFMPSIVHTEQLEKANGRMWSAELVTNTFIGPPLGALLIAVSFSLPFFADAASFVVSAALIALIPRSRPVAAADAPDRKPWRAELAEGFRWLWHHELLRPMAIILGCLNALGMVTGAVLILFGQEVLHTGPTAFAVLTTGGAIGGVIGGWTAGSVSRRLGAGPSLWLTLITSGVTTLLIGLMSWWPAVWFLFAVEVGVGVLWNVITVSLRQSIIPDHLLGRVNSVYRFFAWGMMPIGSLIGGLIVVVTEMFGSRELALRMPWLIAGAAYFVLFAFAAPRLTTAKIEAARANAIERTIA